MADTIIYEHARTIFFERIVTDGSKQERLRCKAIFYPETGRYTITPQRNSKHRGMPNIGVLSGQLSDDAERYCEELAAANKDDDGQLKLPLEND